MAKRHPARRTQTHRPIRLKKQTRTLAPQNHALKNQRHRPITHRQNTRRTRKNGKRTPNTPKKTRNTNRNRSTRQRARPIHRRPAGTQTPNNRLPKRLSTNSFPITPTHNTWTRNRRKPTRNSTQLHRVQTRRTKHHILTPKHAHQRHPPPTPSPLNRS